MDTVFPAFDRDNITCVVPAILNNDYSALPVDLGDAERVLLVVLDGLGWVQLQDRLDVAPTIAALDGGPITTVAPSTTSAALTSLTTGVPPGDHGIVGYRMLLDGTVVNTLRWSNDEGQDLRRTVPPEVVQPIAPFGGHRIDYVAKAEFAGSGFTQASWRGANLVGYRTTSSLVEHVRDKIVDGDFLYCYYPGIDTVAHEYGLGSRYDAELAFVDDLVRQLVDAVPDGTAVLVVSDHGQVHCGDPSIEIDSSLARGISMLSGEGRFRWIHLADGANRQEIQEELMQRYGDIAWVFTLDQIVEGQWMGKHIQPEVLDRLGDVALVPFEPVSFADPYDTGVFDLISRHGGLTPEEMLVPCIGVIK